MFNGCFCNIYRFLFISHRKDFHTLLLTVYLKLCDCSRTIYVTGYKKRFLSFGFQLSCKLGNCRCLTCALKTSHHKNGNLIARLDRKLCCLASHKIYKLIVYNFNYHLSRVQSVHYVLSHCPFLYCFCKLLYNFKVYICLKKSHLYFLQRNFYIFLCKTSLAPKLLKYIL